MRYSVLELIIFLKLKIFQLLEVSLRCTSDTRVNKNRIYTPYQVSLRCSEENLLKVETASFYISFSFDDFTCAVILIISQVQLLIYFMLKYAMEILLSESSVVTTYYFNWNTSAVAIFLAILGLTVLPVNAVVGSYFTNWFEDR